MPPDPEDRPDVQVFDEIGRIEHLVRASVTRHLPVGLTYPQFEVLNRLARRGDGDTPAEIAQALQVTKSGFTNTLQRLEARNLIRVAQCDVDRRRKRLWLTPEGRQAYAQTMKSLRPTIESLRGGFTEGEFRDALPFLRALRGWMSATA
jgi:DNA-binding MarR family transcriptional regulator